MSNWAFVVIGDQTSVAKSVTLRLLSESPHSQSHLMFVNFDKKNAVWDGFGASMCAKGTRELNKDNLAMNSVA